MKQLPKLPVIVLLLVTLLFANMQINKRSGSKTDICFNICGDARGYYAWLPAIFIYHDLNFSFFDTVEVKGGICGADIGIPVQDYRYSFGGKPCDKYYPGTAFMALPFFAVAHIATKYFTHYPPNGYSHLYFLLMALAGICYYFIGMFLYLKILSRLRLKSGQMLLAMLLLSLGTNIIYYAIDAPLYSHIYSFTLIAAFLYQAICLRDVFSLKRIAYISFLAGMIFITRPVNISVFLFVPILFGASGMKKLWLSLTTSPRHLLYLLPALIMPATLCTLYKIATGSFIIYSYGKEGFDFLHPHLWQFIFSYSNGIVPYTPLLLLPFILLAVWYRPEYKRLVWALLATLLVTIYIHSSWWAWDYGFSFGARSLLDFAPLSGIAIAVSIKQAGRRLYILLPVYLLCCALTMILYQQKSAGGYMHKYPITDYWEAIRSAVGIKK